jgi:hypothetical protein
MHIAKTARSTFCPLHTLSMLTKCPCSGCPGETMLPYYLIIGGILTICLVAGRVVTIMVSEKIGKTHENPNFETHHLTYTSSVALSVL